MQRTLVSGQKWRHVGKMSGVPPNNADPSIRCTDTLTHTSLGARVEGLGGGDLFITDELHVREGEDSSPTVDLAFPLTVDVGGQHFDDLPFLKQSYCLSAPHVVCCQAQQGSTHHVLK